MGVITTNQYLFFCKIVQRVIFSQQSVLLGDCVVDLVKDSINILPNDDINAWKTDFEIASVSDFDKDTKKDAERYGKIGGKIGWQIGWKKDFLTNIKTHRGNSTVRSREF